MRIFVSYSHKQGDWVWDKLIPCLRAGGAKPLADRDVFKAGRSVIGQMAHLPGLYFKGNQPVAKPE